MSRSQRILVVGDHFIPEAHFVDALRTVGMDPKHISNRPLGGTKKQQHQDQQIMEIEGPNAIPVDEDLIGELKRHTAVIVHFSPVPAEAFTEGTALEAVFAARAGLENIDVAAATKAGVAVFNVEGRNASAVAELALGLMLAEARNVARADRSVKEGGWRKDFPMTPREVGGATVGLVGYGHVGRELSRRLAGFGTRLLVTDPAVNASLIESEGGELVTINELFAESDFVSLQARLTTETIGLVDRGLLGLMKPTAYLVNVGRSRLVVTEDLLAALENGKIAGAGLDVFDEEPLPHDSRLRQLDNVTLTTHFGGDTVTTNERSARLVALKVSDFFNHGDVAAATNADDLCHL